MWGNPKLVTWDYNKDVNLTLEDALISMESLRFMLGGKLKKATAEEGGKVKVHLTEEVVLVKGESEEAVKLPTVKNHIDDKAYNPQPSEYKYINLDTGDRGEVTPESPLSSGTCKVGDHLRIFWEQEVDGTTNNATATEIVISPNSFPGVYRVYGDTFMRNADGKDQAMQFIIGKAKVLSNTTITMQAEGDPSTFEMTLNVMKSTNEAGESEMFKLVSYEL